MVLYHYEEGSEMDEMLDYCSEYCYTAIEAPEALKHFDKPKWVKQSKK